jgi:amino acid transporter
MSTGTLSADEQRLAELGYKQELKRGWSGFSNFAISFSIISILAGCFTSYGQAFNNGGPVAISIGWPVISVLILCVAFSMSELASAMPTAGGIYYWASKLGGAGWGWFTGWFNLIGLVAVVASVDFAAANFLQALLSMLGVGFIEHAGTSAIHYNAHWVFALFLIILIAHGLINVFSSHLVSLFNGISVWWHVVGVAVIVLILIFGPSHHASLSYVFGSHGRAFGYFGHDMYWFYVLPLGFLLTMYTITGYDASAHVSEETNDAARQAPKGVWRSVFYSAVIGYILLLALTFAVKKTDIAGIGSSGFPAITILQDALSSTAAKVIIAISTIGQLFCGMACVTSASRMTFAFSRDGAIPGHNLWRRLGANRTPTWAVLFVIVAAAVITIPGLFPTNGVPVAFFAVTSISVIGLYIAYTIPIYLRWRMGDRFQAGPWTLGKKYKWVNLIAVVWVALCVIIFSLPVSPAAVYFKSGFSWGSVNYAPLVTLGIIAVVTIWYLVSARHTFTGPVNTFDELDGLEPIAPGPSSP